MTYDLKLERELLVIIRDFPLDLNSPGDQFKPQFPDSIQFFPVLAAYKEFGGDGQWRLLESHLKIIRERGWVEGEEFKNGWGPQQLTDAGHARLDWILDNTVPKKFSRLILGLAEKALSSIVLPILVSILTVYVSQYFLPIQP